MSHTLYDHPKRTGHGESSEKMWSTGEGNGKLRQYSCLKNPMTAQKGKKDRTLKEELPGW